MTLSRIALFGACLALPAALSGGAMAQPADGTRVIQVPPGAVVLILSAPQVSAARLPVTQTAAPDASPVLRLIAQQQALMQRMMSDMDSLLPPMPDPAQMIRAAMAAANQPGVTGAPDVATPPIAGGHGVCGESVSYTFNGSAPPVVHITRYGDACGAEATGGTQTVTTPQPATPPQAHQPKVLEVGYPPRLVAPGSAPRT